jgi:hypothetical protein
MRTIVTEVNFGSLEGVLTIRLARYPDNVSFSDWKPNPADIPDDFKESLKEWLESGG